MRIVKKNEKKQTIESLNIGSGHVFEYCNELWMICDIGELDDLNGSDPLGDYLKEDDEEGSCVVCVRLSDGWLASFSTEKDKITPVVATVEYESK